MKARQCWEHQGKRGRLKRLPEEGMKEEEAKLERQWQMRGAGSDAPKRFTSPTLSALPWNLSLEQEGEERQAGEERGPANLVISSR